MSDLSAIVKEFLVESYENLDRLDRDLVVLEQDPQNRGCLASIFRTIHTIKGTCGFFGFAKLEAVTHVGENLLCMLRDGHLLLDPERTSALLALFDAVRDMLACIETSGTDGDRVYQELIDTLTQLQMPCSSKPQSPTAPPLATPDEPKRSKSKMFGEALVDAGLAKASEVIDALERQHQGDPRHVGEILVEQGAVTPQDVSMTLQAQREGAGPSVAETSIRVDVALLDRLMNLVGELVLTRNQLIQFNATQKDTIFLSTTQRLNLITTELQESVMKTRMQPISNIWNRFPRIIRDLALSCGKLVRLEMEGKDTELDKTIIEAIKDPLTHIVRNSLDHGIETPNARLQRGKRPEGTLLMRASHEGGQVNIEIIDDGGGIDPARVKAKALERGLITREQAARMPDREAIHLIFLPGFSTAEKITNVSGRGVGMDVVKTNIEKIGGTVDVQSQLGVGTTLKIKIPLTLAIIPALIVTSGGDRFAIPQVSLLELVRLEGEQARKSIQNIHGAPVYRLRGNLLPLVYLNHELQTAPVSPTTDPINIVVLQADDCQFGLVVEGINDTEEIVVKPLGKQLKCIPLFAGATIMGDGRVALILDVLGIAQRSGVISEVRDRSIVELAAKAEDSQDNRQTLLLFGLGADSRMAIPLSLVARLEEIPADSVERADGQEVVQYRDQILPLIRLGDLLGRPQSAPADMLQVIVFTENARSVGLVVDRILDIVETPLEIKRAANRHGILGAAIVQQRVTDLLDVRGIIKAADPTLLEAAIAG